MRRLSFFLIWGFHTAGLKLGALYRLTVRFSAGFLHEIRYWLRKHRIDMPLDSQGLVRLFCMRDWIRESLDFPPGLREQE